MSSLRTAKNILELIVRLQQPLGIDKKQIAADFEVHPKTIRRYLTLLQEVGFEVAKHPSGRIYLSEKNPHLSFDHASFFSQEECLLIKEALSHYLKDSKDVNKALKKVKKAI